MIQVHSGLVTMRRKTCPILLLLIVTVNQSQGYGIKGINSGLYSGSYSSASASAHSSSFSSSYSSDGHLPKLNEFPSAAYASANANAGSNAGAQANAGAIAGSWAGSNPGAGVNSISGSTGGSYHGSTGAGSTDFAGNYGHGQNYDGTSDNKAAPVKYTSGSPSYGNNFAGGASGSSTSGSYGPHSGTGTSGCCKGPFPGPNGSIHDYKPAPPGGGGPDPAWLQGGSTGPIHPQQTPHTGPSYTVPSTASQGTTGLTSQIIHSFPGKPGSIHDHKPASAGATAAAASVAYQGASNGPNGCGVSNPDCSKGTGTQNTAYGSSTTGTANTDVTHGYHANPSTSLDFIGKLPGHKGSIYDHKPSAQPTHSLPSVPTTSGSGTTSSHTSTTLSPGSSANSVIGKLPGPTTGIGYSKPATTSVTNPAVDNVPLIHVIVPTVGGSGQTSTTTHKPSGFYSPSSTTYTTGQMHGQAGTTGVAVAISTDLTPPEYSPNKQPENNKPVYESTSENIGTIGGSHPSPLQPEHRPDTSGTPTYTSKPNTLSPYFQSSNPSKVPVNGICPFGSPNCHKSSNVPEPTPSNSIVHPGTGNLPIDGSTAESYGPTSKPTPGYAGVPVVVQQPGCTGLNCGTGPKDNYPGNSPPGCSGTACGGSSSPGHGAPGYSAVPVCVGVNCESGQKGNYPGYSSQACSGASCGGTSTPQDGFANGHVAVDKSPSSGCSGASCSKIPDSENSAGYPNTASGQSGYNAVPVAVQQPECTGTNCKSGPKGNYPSTSPQGCFGASCGGTSYGGSTANSNSGSSYHAGFATGSVDIQKSPSSGCSGSTCIHVPGNGDSGKYPEVVNGASGNGFATGSVVIQKENGQVTTGNDNPGSYYPGGTGNHQPGSYNSGANGANCIGDYCKHSGTNPENGNDKPDQKDCSNGGCSSGIKGGGNTAASGSYSHQGYQGGCGSGSCGNAGGAGISNSGSFSGSYSGSQFGSGNPNTGSYSHHGQPDGSGCAQGKCGTGGSAGSGAGSYSSSYSSSGSGSGCGSGGCGPFGSFSGSSAYSSAGSGAGYGFPDFAKQFGGAFSKAFSASGSKSSASSFSGAIASSGGSY